MSCCIAQVMDHVWIRHHMKVPETPLCTPAVLKEEKEAWGDMQACFSPDKSLLKQNYLYHT